MKIKCMHCNQVYDVNGGACPSCGKQGGFMQEPKCVQLGDLNIHLEEVLIHIASKNEYQVKEIQANGMVAVLASSPTPLEQALKGKKVYISNTVINEYVRK